MKRILCWSRNVVFGLVLVIPGVISYSGHAATRFWDGGGASGFWDASANWSNNAAPINGDALVFPASANRLVNTNRASGGLTNFSSLRFLGDDYQIFGAALNITNGITNIPAIGVLNTLNAEVHPRANQTWLIGNRKLLTLNSNVVFPATPAITLTVDAGSGGALVMNGSFIGNNAVDLVKVGSGKLDLNDNSNKVHVLTVADGTVNLDGRLNGTLVISNGATLQGTGAVDAVTCAGDLRPGGTVPGIITFNTANCSLQAGARFIVDINGLTPGVDYDQLQVSLGLPLNGAELVVQRSQTFAFAIGQRFVIINNVNLSLPTTSTFTNLPADGLITNNGVVFQINYAGGFQNNDVELKVVDVPFAPTGVTRTWTANGGTGNPRWAHPFNWDNNTTPIQGDDLVFPASIAQGSRLMTNDFNVASAQFNHLYFGGQGLPWVLRGNSLTLFGGLIATNDSTPTGPVQLATETVNLGASQTWSLTNSSVRLEAPVLFGSNTLTLASHDTSSILFGRELLGPGTLVVRKGFVELPFGLAVSNLAVRVEGGTLGANDALATGPAWEMLSGEMSFDSIQIPGLVAKGGVLKCLGNVQAIINGDLAFGHECSVIAEFEHPNPLLVVSGDVRLLNAHLLAGPIDSSLIGIALPLIDNTGTNSVDGIFAGLPEGALVAYTNESKGVFFSRISYVGGDGNDVTVTPVLTPPYFVSLQRLGNGDVLLQGTATPDSSITIEASEDFQDWHTLGVTASGFDGQFTLTDHPGSLGRRFYRAFAGQ